MRSEFDVDKFVADTAKLHDDPSYLKLATWTLPNEGESLDDICKAGLGQYRKNIDCLKNLLDD